MNYRGLNIPKVSFGNLDSDALFCDKEQEIFDFYERSQDRYLTALDIGANIGVHTLLMARQGWCVKAFEPDPGHYAELSSNVHASRAGWRVEWWPMAVSDRNGRSTFVRVKGNTTGSHLKGDKDPYGELEEFEVETVDCRPLFEWAQFAKIDCEGHEARLLLTATPEHKCEFMVEVGNYENAEKIFRHFQGWRGMWAQKSGWKPVTELSEMPMHHSHGALFIGSKAP